MTGLDWAFLPLLTVLATGWLFALAARRYLAAYLLMYALTGAGFLAAVSYAASGWWYAAGMAGVITLGSELTRFLFGPNGMRVTARQR